MPFQNRKALPGSERQPLPGYQPAGEVDPSETISVSVILRPKSGHIDQFQHPERLSRAEFEAKRAAPEEDIRLVEQFAAENGLAVAEASAVKRRVVLTGTAADLQRAFETKLQVYRHGSGKQYRGRTGALSIPEELHGVVIAILGLDNRPTARAHHCIRRAEGVAPQAQANAPVPVPQIAQLYNYPPGVNGSGQTIGILELGGGYNQSDLDSFFSGIGLSTPTVTAVSVDGATNSPDGQSDVEVMLDIEVAGALAPGAKYAVYFAPNTDQGFIDAVTDAAHDTANAPGIISISWGGPEDTWTQQSQTALNAALQDAASLGITVTVAAGDSGSSDGQSDGNLHVDFPAASPYVLACGGTTLVANGSSISSETVWNEIANQEGATGGGVSKVFPIPSYQANAGVPANPNTNFAGRGVPDVAGNADPSTGYTITADGQSQVVGGTSAVAPLWAALIALLNQTLGKNAGFVNAALYNTPSSFNDITSGSNDDQGLGYYSAGPGWDACTGLGSPNGTAILSALQSAASVGSGG